MKQSVQCNTQIGGKPDFENGTLLRTLEEQMQIIKRFATDLELPSALHEDMG
jgi:hypothetical protein